MIGDWNSQWLVRWVLWHQEPAQRHKWQIRQWPQEGHKQECFWWWIFLFENLKLERACHCTPDNLLACLQLFAGETAFTTRSRRYALKQIIQTNTQMPHGEPLHIVTARGYEHCYSRSDLEVVCKELMREDEAKNYNSKQSSVPFARPPGVCITTVGIKWGDALVMFVKFQLNVSPLMTSGGGFEPK